MACISCRSENVKAFTSEINIHFPGKAHLTKSLLAYPKILICLDCGLADVLLSEELGSQRRWNWSLDPRGSTSALASTPHLALFFTILFAAVVRM